MQEKRSDEVITFSGSGVKYTKTREELDIESELRAELLKELRTIESAIERGSTDFSQDDVRRVKTQLEALKKK